MCQLKKKHLKKYIFFSADMQLGGRVIKMAVICQPAVTWLHYCTDMIANILTFHLIPNLSHLIHIQHCYEVIITKAKFCPRELFEFYCFIIPIFCRCSSLLNIVMIYSPFAILISTIANQMCLTLSTSSLQKSTPPHAGYENSIDDSLSSYHW